MKKKLYAIVLTVFLIVGCGTFTPAQLLAPPTNTPTETFTPTSTLTPTLTLTPFPTATPTPIFEDKTDAILKSGGFSYIPDISLCLVGSCREYFHYGKHWIAVVYLKGDFVFMMPFEDIPPSAGDVESMVGMLSLIYNPDLSSWVDNNYFAGLKEIKEASFGNYFVHIETKNFPEGSIWGVVVYGSRPRLQATMIEG